MKLRNRCADCICAVVRENPATARLIGLCPMLAVSDTTLKAIALGIMVATILIISATIASLLRYSVSRQLKPLYHVLVAAFTTTGVIASASIAYYELIDAMGIYPALIASNCLVLSIIQEVAERKPLQSTIKQGIHDAVFLVAFLGIFGAARELGAYGFVFTDWGLINSLHSVGASANGPIPLLATAPGALLLLALVLAGTNAISRRHCAPETDRRESGNFIVQETVNVGPPEST